jgi:hypothetical protein
MENQFINNSSPPPTESVLQYSINPDTVFVSTDSQQMYANLTITVFNPQSYAVTCQMFKFGLYVGAQYGDLTTSTTGIQTSSDQTNWTISPTATEDPDIPTLYQFSAPTSGMANQQLAPNQSLVFHLDGILINQAVGEGGVPIAITEATGADTNNLSVVQGEITISKEEPTLSAQLSVIPPTPINRGEEVNFSWQVAGAEYWLLYGGSTTPLYDSRYSEPPNATTYGPVSPQVSTTYQLLAYAGQLYTGVEQEVSVMAAQFVINPSANPTTVEPGGSAILSWQTLYASQLVITASDPNFKPVTLNAPAGQYDYFPDAPNNQWPVSPEKTTTYTLEIYGPGNSQDQGQVQISVNPPQIISFTADPVVFNSGAGVELSWQTQGAAPDSAMLQQSVKGNQDINTVGLNLPVNDTAYKVNPTGISTYYLTVQGEGSAASELMVFEALGTYLNLGSNWEGNWVGMAMAFDGANVWASAYVSSSYGMFKIQDSSGNILNTYGFGSAVSLAFDGTYVWCAMNMDGKLTKLKASDASTQDLFIAGGYAPSSVTFDGTDIWVGASIGNDNYVLRMRTSDGQVLAAFKMPAPLDESISYDGSYVWTTFQDPRCIVKLQTSDGSVQQTISLTYYDFPTGMAFDGTNIWVGVGNGTEGHYILIIPTVGGGSPQKIPLSVMPTALCFDGTYVWVANYDGTISRF